MQGAGYSRTWLARPKGGRARLRSERLAQRFRQTLRDGDAPAQLLQISDGHPVRLRLSPDGGQAADLLDAITLPRDHATHQRGRLTKPVTPPRRARLSAEGPAYGEREICMSDAAYFAARRCAASADP